MQPVNSILHLEHAQRLAALSDGLLLMLDADTLEGHPLPGIRVSSIVCRVAELARLHSCAAMWCSGDICC